MNINCFMKLEVDPRSMLWELSPNSHESSSTLETTLGPQDFATCKTEWKALRLLIYKP